MKQSLHRRSKGRAIFSGLLLLAFFFPGVAAATSASDEFIRGYATAILQRDFQITAETLSVQSGVVYIRGLEASDVVRDRMKTSLSSIEGVRQVVVAKKGEGALAPTGEKSRYYNRSQRLPATGLALQIAACRSPLAAFLCLLSAISAQ